MAETVRGRPKDHVSYGPGKFEGEACWTRFAHWASGQGFGLPVGQDEDDNTQRHDGPFTQAEVDQFELDTHDLMCEECLVELLGARRLFDWEDSQGFAYATLE